MNLYETLQNRINLYVKQSIKEAVDEEKVVKFNNNEVYPKNGIAVIMAGGAGSGKGYVINNFLPIDGKVFDVDHLKTLYSELSTKEGSSINAEDGYEYDFGNSDDVQRLHKKVSQKGWKGKSRRQFFQNQRRDNLQNVIFDITGKGIKDIAQASTMCKEIGYTVYLVWVLTSRQRAMWQNLNRERRLNQKIFHDIHNAIYDFLPDFIKNGAAQYVDNVWLVFNSSMGLSQKTDEETTYTSIKLERNGNGFTIPQDVEKRIYDTLGVKETNPNNPQVYKDFDTLLTHTRDKMRVPVPQYGHDYNGNPNVYLK